MNSDLNLQTMTLTPEEQKILNGDSGTLMAKIMKSVVLYGEAMGATKMIPISGPAHAVISFAPIILGPHFAMLDDLIKGGLKITPAFTADPRPVDYRIIKNNLWERFVFNFALKTQPMYETQLINLGLKNTDAFTCTCYLPEVGNIPEKGQLLGWSESSAVSFANSVIGARTNRNSGGIDFLMNILGKAPYHDLLTDEGRKARWLIKVQTSEKPNAQLLGSAIGIKIMEDVPFIEGLSTFLGTELTEEVKSYLKDFGAAAASNGAVGLYHVENLTPEVVDSGRDLLIENFQTYIIDDNELQRVYDLYPNIWKKSNANPLRCFIGCPHLSLQQLYEWTNLLADALKSHHQKKLKVKTYLISASDVIKKFEQNTSMYQKSLDIGARTTSFLSRDVHEHSLY